MDRNSGSVFPLHPRRSFPARRMPVLWSSKQTSLCFLLHHLDHEFLKVAPAASHLHPWCRSWTVQPKLLGLEECTN